MIAATTHVYVSVTQINLSMLVLALIGGMICAAHTARDRPVQAFVWMVIGMMTAVLAGLPL